MLALFLMASLSASSFGISIDFQIPPAEDSLKIIEIIYLHTDCDSYYPGDDILIKKQDYENN